MNDATDWVTGKLGNAFDFNGSNGRVVVPHNASLNFGTGDFTIEAWVKLDQLNRTNMVYDKGSTGRVSLFINSNNTLRVHVIASGSTKYYDSTIKIPDTGWHYLAVSADRNGNALFAIDTTTQTKSMSDSVSNNLNSSSSAVIGARQNQNAHFFKGLMDEVALYTVALSVAELQAHASGGGTPTVVTPTFSPAPGSYTNSVQVSMSTTTSGAQIRYTTNGATPTTSSTLYTGPITLTSTTTTLSKSAVLLTKRFAGCTTWRRRGLTLK